MREIKFRALDRSNNNWYELSLSELMNGESSAWCDIDEETISQFTGLYDKNGREIYEGDTVDFPPGHDYYMMGGATGQEVDWNDCGGWYPFCDAEDNMPYPKPNECVVSGNVYETIKDSED